MSKLYGGGYGIPGKGRDEVPLGVEMPRPRNRGDPACGSPAERNLAILEKEAAASFGNAPPSTI
jgi:hypothetical protein